MSYVKMHEIYLSTARDSGLFTRNFRAFLHMTSIVKLNWKPVYCLLREL